RDHRDERDRGDEPWQRRGDARSRAACTRAALVTESRTRRQPRAARRAKNRCRLRRRGRVHEVKLRMMRRARSLVPDLAGATAADVVELADASGVRFLRLQFTDILGVNKNVEIPATRLEKALAGDILFDGSSIEGFVRTEESDMLLRPDLRTF